MPGLSLRTGLVSHFFRALTERREPRGEEGEQGLELPEAWGGMEPTEGVMLPSLLATEYDSVGGEGERYISEMYHGW